MCVLCAVPHHLVGQAEAPCHAAAASTARSRVAVQACLAAAARMLIGWHVLMCAWHGACSASPSWPGWLPLQATTSLSSSQPKQPPTYPSPRSPAQVLMWTRDMKRAQELAWLVATEYAKLLMDLGEPLEGVAEWLQVGTA